MAANAEATVTLSLIDRVTGPIKRIAARLGALSKRMGIDRLGASIAKVGQKLKGVGVGLAQTSGRLAATLGLFGAAGAGAVAAAYNLVQTASDVGSEIGDTAGKLGIGVEALQEYRFAAKQSGVETATLDKGIEKLGVNAVLATKGNKELAKGFKQLGVRLKDTHGKMRSTEDILDDTMAALSRIKDPLQRNALAFKLFGKSGVDLTKILSDGASGLRELREEARRTGGILGSDAVKAADEFGDNLDALKDRISSVGLMIGVQLLPAFNDIVKSITEWVDANRGLISSTISEWVKTLAQFMRDLLDPTSSVRIKIDDLAAGFKSFVDTVSPVVDFLGGPLKVAFIGMAAWIAGPTVAALVSLAGAFVALGTAILSTPIGWVLIALAAVGAAGYVLYQQWDQFVSFWSDSWGRIKSAFATSWTNGIMQLIAEWHPVVLIAKAFNAVFEYFTGIDLAPYALTLWETFKTGAIAGWAIVSAWFDEKVKSIKDMFAGAATFAYDAGGIIVNALWEGIKSKWQDLVDWLHGAMQDLVGWLPTTLQEKLGFKVDVGGDAAKAAGDAGSRIGGMISPAAPQVVPQAVTSIAQSPSRASVQMPSLAPANTPDSVQTNTVTAQSIQVADPILVHQPMQVNAQGTYTVTVNAQGMTPEQAQAAVSRGLADAQARQAASARAALTDQ